MPSGYTAGVQSGEITDFKDYAMGCARAFGALVMMRDDPSDAEIPEKFEPSKFSRDRLVKLRKELDQFKAMGSDERRDLHESEHRDEIASAEKRLAEIAEQRARYEAMLGEARAYVAPTPDHEKFAEFMVKQLVDSIDWDCKTEYYDKKKEKAPFRKWEYEKVKDLERSIESAKESWNEEQERTAGRNKWIAELRESLSKQSA